MARPGGFTNANRISEFGVVSASNLYIDLAGTTPGAQYDVIDCGPATASIVGGTLRVNLLGAFQPAVGQHFDILTAASFTEANRVFGDALVDKHLAMKRRADPAMILNRDVIF